MDHTKPLSAQCIPAEELKKMFPWLAQSIRTNATHAEKKNRKKAIGRCLLVFAMLSSCRMLAQVGPADCLTQFTFTATPPPTNGIYLSGQTVQFCYTVQNFNLINNNWFHALVPSFGPGWEMNTLNITSTPNNCDGGNGGWVWANGCSLNGSQGSAGPGWFYDLNADGDPCNNFGDVGSGCIWQFCWSIQVASGADCVNGASLNVSVDTYGDSETGSWGSPGCANDPVATLNASAVCCSADAGEDATVVLCYADASLDPLDALNGTPDSGGDWTAPNEGPFIGSIDPTTAQGGTYTYTIEQTSPCPDLSAQLVVIIDPAINLEMNSDTAICEGSSVLINPSLSGGTSPYQVTWSEPINGIGPHLVIPYESTVYELVVVDDLGCSVQGQTDITVNPTPRILVSVDDPVVCKGTPITFTNNTPSYMVGASCVWNMGNGILLQECESLSYVFPEHNCHDITLTVISPFGCVGDSTFADLICIRPNPIAAFAYGPQPADMDDTRIDFENQTFDSTAWVSYHWEFGTNGTLSTSTLEDPFHYYPNNDSGSYTVDLIVENVYGCVDSAQQVVVIDGVTRPFIPNAFTPDGDGTNDLWLVEGLGFSRTQFDLAVFDRWGREFYSTDDPSEGWNGRYMNYGDEAPVGVYVYRVISASDFSSARKVLEGHVNLIR